MESNYYYEDLEMKKAEIIFRFYARPKVKLYLQKLTKNKMIPPSWGEEISGISGISEEVKEDICDLLKLSQIKAIYIHDFFTIDHGTWWYDCEAINKIDLDFYLPIFFQEFSLYPISLIKKSKLKSIYFCQSLTFSTDTYSQYRAAVPDYSEVTMSMVYCCKEKNIDYCRKVIHHEFFHFVDYVEDGKIFGPDPEWEELNTPEFKYGNGGHNNREWKALEQDKRGFLNFYSTTGVEEDKAEIFAHLMCFPEKVEKETCQILMKKFEFIKTMMMKFDIDGFGDAYFWDVLKILRDGINNYVS
jgi:hypothetical protein